MGGQLGFMYRQLAFHPKPVPDNIRIDGQTALVTGAGTIGSLGHAAAKEMAAHGLSRLIIAARSVTKAEAVRQDIVQGHSGVDVEVWELDYESWPSIEAFTRQAAQLDRLDIVVLSAGIKFLEYKRSGTGMRRTCRSTILVRPCFHSPCWSPCSERSNDSARRRNCMCTKHCLPGISKFESSLVFDRHSIDHSLFRPPQDHRHLRGPLLDQI